METKTQLDGRNQEQDLQISQLFSEIQVLESRIREIQRNGNSQPNIMFLKISQLAFEHNRPADKGNYLI